MKRRKIAKRKEIKKRKIIAITSTLVILLLISVGYGAFQTSINIQVQGTVNKCKIGRTWKYEYTGEPKEFKAPCGGTYKIELWGASGGMIIENNSYGGYASGKININENKKLYIYVGEAGKRTETVVYNGGGGAAKGYDDVAIHPERVPVIGNSGGGATDVRTANGKWNDFQSLKSRVIVAAGGGGSFAYSNYGSNIIGEHSFAGGIIGYSGCSYNADNTINTRGFGGTQIEGGQAGIPYDSEGNVETGGFGYGGSTLSWSGDNPASGGGSGYYGGGAGAGSSGNGKQGFSGGNGGGGSSFISGHEGCDAIDEFSTEDNIIHTGRSVHYSGLYFTETEIIDGSGYKWTDHKLEDLGIVGMPTHSGIGTMIGNNGNGYAKITLLSKN